jgi:hypothetical protein
MGKHRSHPLLNPHINPGSEEDRRNIREENCCVDRKVFEWESRDLGSKLRITSDLEEVTASL